MIDASTCTTEQPQSISLATMLEAIDEAYAIFDQMDESSAASWKKLAAKHGFSLERGDTVLLPPGCELYVPASLRKQIRVHYLVRDVTFIKSGLLGFL